MSELQIPLSKAGFALKTVKRPFFLQDRLASVQKETASDGNGRLGGAHAPRVRFPAPALETSALVALRKEFDEGVEHDSRGRLCSPSILDGFCLGRMVAVRKHPALVGLRCSAAQISGRRSSTALPNTHLRLARGDERRAKIILRWTFGAIGV